MLEETSLELITTYNVSICFVQSLGNYLYGRNFKYQHNFQYAKSSIVFFLRRLIDVECAIRSGREKGCWVYVSCRLTDFLQSNNIKERVDCDIWGLSVHVNRKFIKSIKYNWVWLSMLIQCNFWKNILKWNMLGIRNKRRYGK